MSATLQQAATEAAQRASCSGHPTCGLAEPSLPLSGSPHSKSLPSFQSLLSPASLVPPSPRQFLSPPAIPVLACGLLTILSPHLPEHCAAPQPQNLLFLPAVGSAVFISQDAAWRSLPAHSSRPTSSYSVHCGFGSMRDYTFLTMGSLSPISLEVTGLGLTRESGCH